MGPAGADGADGADGIPGLDGIPGRDAKFYHHYGRHPNFKPAHYY